jgi:hypothetical protein
VNHAPLPATLENFFSDTETTNYTERQDPSWDVNDILQAVTYVTGKRIPKAS